VFFESRNQVRRNRLGTAALDHVAMDEVHYFPILENGNRRRAGLVIGEVAPGPRSRIEVLARKDTI